MVLYRIVLVFLTLIGAGQCEVGVVQTQRFYEGSLSTRSINQAGQIVEKQSRAFVQIKTYKRSGVQLISYYFPNSSATGHLGFQRSRVWRQLSGNSLVEVPFHKSYKVVSGDSKPSLTSYSFHRVFPDGSTGVVRYENLSDSYSEKVWRKSSSGQEIESSHLSVNLVEPWYFYKELFLNLGAGF